MFIDVQGQKDLGDVSGPRYLPCTPQFISLVSLDLLGDASPGFSKTGNWTTFFDKAGGFNEKYELVS